MSSKPQKNAKSLGHITLPGAQGFVRLITDGSRYWIHRFAERGKINNYVSEFELIDSNGQSHIHPLNEANGRRILERLAKGQNYSSCFVFRETNTFEYSIPKLRSESEHKYTSTGIKFWRHQEAMENYSNGNPNTVISTHISPEGACNLKCPYCSVTYRDSFSRLELDTIKGYVEKLQSRGLKAVILTGGGEPTIYRNFNELVRFLKNQGLSVALITNGTQTHRVEPETWKEFEWIRVSINIFDGWQEKINLPVDFIDFDKTTVGCSMVYTVEHESTEDISKDRLSYFREVQTIADKVQAKYIRLLPNCLLDQENLLAVHQSLDHTLNGLKDDRFFHQFKVHGAPKTSRCHQSYFRPYLSEEPFEGKPGAVYPCDSVVLNQSFQYFAKKYQLCHADNILDYIDRRIEHQFDAKKDCEGCVFTENVNLIEDLSLQAKIDSPNFHKSYLMRSLFSVDSRYGR